MAAGAWQDSVGLRSGKYGLLSHQQSTVSPTAERHLFTSHPDKEGRFARVVSVAVSREPSGGTNFKAAAFATSELSSRTQDAVWVEAKVGDLEFPPMGADIDRARGRVALVGRQALVTLEQI
jgi:hypothetical protein